MTSANHGSAARGSRWLPVQADHLRFLASERWAQLLQRDLLPWLQAAGPLGDDVLEIGPGPGLTTDLLRTIAPRVTAVELDPVLAARLDERLAGAVSVVHADATHATFAAGRFSTVTCFHVLHHVPTLCEQDALVAEVLRVLRPSGVFLCVDALDLPTIRAAHREQGETFLPIDAAAVTARWRALGFSRVEAITRDYQLLVRATR